MLNDRSDANSDIPRKPLVVLNFTKSSRLGFTIQTACQYFVVHFNKLASVGWVVFSMNGRFRAKPSKTAHLIVGPQNPLSVKTVLCRPFSANPHAPFGRGRVFGTHQLRCCASDTPRATAEDSDFREWLSNRTYSRIKAALGFVDQQSRGLIRNLQKPFVISRTLF